MVGHGARSDAIHRARRRLPFYLSRSSGPRSPARLVGEAASFPLQAALLIGPVEFAAAVELLKLREMIRAQRFAHAVFLAESGKPVEIRSTTVASSSSIRAETTGIQGPSPPQNRWQKKLGKAAGTRMLRNHETSV